MLLDAPLLLQPHTPPERTAHVVFPVADASAEAPAEEAVEVSVRLASEASEEASAEEAEAAEGADGAKPAAPPRAAVAEAARVQQLLQLDHSLGFVQLGRAAEAPTGGREEGWHPLAVHFGLPLFDVPLCGAACARVASGDLLQNESVAAYRARSAELLARLNEFVGRHADADEVAAAAAEGGVAYPVHDLEFDGAALRVLPEEVGQGARLGGAG